MTFLGSGGDKREVSCPDDMYILDAAGTHAACTPLHLAPLLAGPGSVDGASFVYLLILRIACPHDHVAPCLALLVARNKRDTVS